MMNKILKALQPDQGFAEEVSNYKKKDALFAIALFLAMCGLYAILAALETGYVVIRENIRFIGGIFNIAMSGMTVLLVLMRNEKLSSIGLYGGQWKKSCVIGLILASLLFFMNCLSNIFAGATWIAARDIAGLVFYYLTIHSVGWLLDLFVTHIILTFIYMKTNSLYGAVIPHWMSNLAYNMISW